MKKALVMTVGTGTRVDSDIVQPLKKSINNARPDRVVFLVTTTSRPHAERIAAELDLGARASLRDLSRPDDPDDVEQVFVDALDVLRGLFAEGFVPEEIEADYTSGTKAMTAGLTLAAVATRCGSLRYIFGQREHGVVVPGTERFLSIPPARVLAHHDLHMVPRLLRDLQFEAARRVLAEIRPGLLDPHGRRMHETLGHLVNAYDCWDKFDHDQSKDQYRKPAADLPEVADLAIPDEVRGRIARMAAASDTKRTLDWRKRITEDHLADLWNNAERRRFEGKYDDAVARLYRLTEMLAQFILATKFGIDTSNVDLAVLPETVPVALVAKLSAKLAGSRKKIDLGLREAYELLSGLGHPLGAELPAPEAGHTRLSQLLSARNASILAHGLTPIGADVARALSEETARLAQTVIPDFPERCALLQFPWLRAER